MKQFFSEGVLLLLLLLAVFLWQKSSFSVYTISLLGILTVLYLITTFHDKNRIKVFPIFLLIACSLLLILASGGLHSALFFLLYFLSFTIAFILTPATVFVFNVGLFLFFFPDALQGNIVENFTKLSSLLLLSPIAYFFAQEIYRREKRARQTKETVKKIEADISEVIQAEGTNLKEPEVQKLTDIVKQTRELEKETTK